MKRLFPLPHIAFLLLCLITVSCGGDGNPNSSNGDSIEITPSTVKAVIGQEVQFKNLFADRSQWSSSNPAVATFDHTNIDKAIFSCKSAGTTQITMTYEGKTATASLEVIPSGNWLLAGLTELSRYGQYSTTDVQFLDSNYGWMVGGSITGAIGLLTTNGGVSWQERFPRFQI